MGGGTQRGCAHEMAEREITMMQRERERDATEMEGGDRGMN